MLYVHSNYWRKFGETYKADFFSLPSAIADTVLLFVKNTDKSKSNFCFGARGLGVERIKTRFWSSAFDYLKKDKLQIRYRLWRINPNNNGYNITIQHLTFDLYADIEAM